MPGFLDLPVEIRLRIYHSLPKTWCFTDVPIYDYTGPPTIADHLEYAFDLAIIRVNKHISEEGKSALYN